MKRILSILAIATMATSIASISSPAKALTWDDAWNVIKKGVDSSLSTPSENTGTQSPQDTTGNQPSQPNPSDSSSNRTPSPSTTSNTQQPQPSNFSAPPQQVSQKLRVSCITANGNEHQNVGRDDSDAMISAGRRTFRPFRKVSVGYSNYERTCRIISRPPSEKISQAFIIADGSYLTSARITIYVDGQEKVSSVINRGNPRMYTFDIAGAENYAVVIKSIDGQGEVYMVPVKQPN
jgi:hypothetical protein